ncbi:MAG: hypothetical protein ABW172_15210 [Candidatus Binatia bacterium]
MRFFQQPAQRSETCAGIRIHGGDEFLRETQKALTLLKPTARFPEIQRHIYLIAQGRRSGMKAWAKEPTFVVGAATWRHSTLWYAGAIAHDAYHAKLYAAAKQTSRGNEPNPDSWTGAEAEKQCLAFQLQVLQELNADVQTMGYLEGCLDHPTYQGRNRGWRSWLDYLKRGW